MITPVLIIHRSSANHRPIFGRHALVGAWVELIRTRRAVGSNGGSSLHDGLGEVKRDVRAIRTTQTEQGERIARLEAKAGG
ncbi:hypothetical protein [Haloechinothrix salitolerans]|uniref:Uncharacterized protein n=1 Tax=Haloechinothrix salitolerans TaxID=926830 RepID=A0ABW2BYG0_9PSEU